MRAQIQARLPWFMEARPSAACAKGGAGAYSNALQRDANDPGGVAGLRRGVVAASAFRTSYVPLSQQTDFIDGFKVQADHALMSASSLLCACCHDLIHRQLHTARMAAAEPVSTNNPVTLQH